MKLLIFDLDGTLVDSGRDIALSVNELLETTGRAPLPVDRILSYVGNGARKLVARAMPGLTDEALDGAVARYLEIYRRRLLDTTVPYPGVRDALELWAPSRALAVLTNKPLRESLAILDGLNLRRYFSAVHGGDSFPRRKPDPIGVEHLIEEHGCEPSETLFIGDTAVDARTAQNARIAFCLVTYGLAPPGSAPIDADVRVDDLRELGPFLGAAVAR